MKTLLCKACLFIIFIVCSLTVAAQSDSLKIDSLKKVLQTEKEDTNKVNTLNEIAINILETDAKNNMFYAKQALSLADKLNFKRGKEIAYVNIALEDPYQSNNTGFIKNLLQAIKISIELGEKRNTGLYYSDIGEGYFGEENYPEALKNLYEALKLFEQINDKPGLPIVID